MRIKMSLNFVSVGLHRLGESAGSILWVTINVELDVPILSEK